MKKSVVLACAIALMMLCGCTGYREIDQGYIVTAIGFKKNSDETEIVLEVLTPSGTAEKVKDTNVLSGTGKSEKEAYNDIKSQLVKDIYLDHCGLVAIEGGFNTKELTEVLQFCNTLQSLNIGAYVINTNNVEDLFDAKAVRMSVGYDVIRLIKNAAKGNGQSFSNQVYQLQRDFSAGKSPQIPLVNITDKKISLELGR